MIPFQKQFILPEANIAETRDYWEIVIDTPAIDSTQTKISVKNGKVNLKGKIDIDKCDATERMRH